MSWKELRPRTRPLPPRTHLAVLLCVPWALLWTAPPLEGGVWVVDDEQGAGSDFALIQQAIDVAQDGDVILVRPGSYNDPFSISGKSLAVVADGGPVSVNYTCTVDGLAPDQDVLLQGLSLGPTDDPLRVTDSSGTVWVRGCSLRAESFVTGDEYTAFAAEQCDALVVSESDVSAADFQGGGYAATLEDSALFAFDSTFDGGTADFFVDGGDGLHLVGGSVHAANTVFRGGPGGGGAEIGPGACIDAGDGGDGIEMAPGGPSSGVLLHCTLEAGAAGQGEGACPPGAPGEAALIEPSSELSVVPVTGPPRHAEITGLVRPGETGTLSLYGASGDLAFVVVGGPPSPLALSQALAAAVPAFPWDVASFGVLPAEGEVEFPFTSPLPPGADALRVNAQPLFFGAEDGFVFGTPVTTILLGPGL